MGKNLNPKNSMVNFDTRFNQEELDKYAWRRNVLDSHIQTTQEARKVIEDSKTWRKRIERSWDEIREVSNIWNNYENRLKTALNNLSSRIEEFEKDQEDNKIKEETLEQKEKEEQIKMEEDKRKKEIANSWVRILLDAPESPKLERERSIFQILQFIYLELDKQINSSY